MKAYSRITITGHKGILGSQFARLLEPEHLCHLIDLPEIDITDRDSMRRELLEFAPDLLIHCAAYTAVDRAESEPETAFKVNALATGWIAQACAEIGAHMVYSSTDYIFCDTPGVNPRTEFDSPAPRGVYARSKFAGEEQIRVHQPRHFIIRTSWLYGPGGKNFVDSIIRAGKEKQHLTVVNDQFGSPTYAPDLAAETLKVIDFGAFGTYHITGNGRCSWFEFAREILKIAGIAAKIHPLSTAEYNAPAPRPGYSVLDHLALRNTIGDNMPNWKESLGKYLNLKRKEGAV